MNYLSWKHKVTTIQKSSEFTVNLPHCKNTECHTMLLIQEESFLSITDGVVMVPIQLHVATQWITMKDFHIHGYPKKKKDIRDIFLVFTILIVFEVKQLAILHIQLGKLQSTQLNLIVEIKFNAPQNPIFAASYFINIYFTSPWMPLKTQKHCNHYRFN